MQSDLARRISCIQEDMKAAEMWRTSGNSVRASTSTDAAAWNSIALAVRENANIDEMRRHPTWDLVRGALLQALSAKLGVVSLVDAGKQPGSVTGGSALEVDLSHFSCAVGELPIARQYAQIAAHPESLALSGPFWREYAKVHWALWTGGTYAPNVPVKLRAMERYWSVYVELMVTAMAGDDIKPLILRAKESFLRRNADRSLTYDDDAYQTEGIGLAPVRWDYRLDGILALIEHKKSTASH